VGKKGQARSLTTQFCFSRPSPAERSLQHGPDTGKFTTLDPHGSMSTTLNGINDLGQIVGFYTDPHGNTDGLLANPNLIGIAGVGHMMHV
jgi:hypothetical protein